MSPTTKPQVDSTTATATATPDKALIRKSKVIAISIILIVYAWMLNALYHSTGTQILWWYLDASPNPSFNDTYNIYGLMLLAFVFINMSVSIVGVIKSSGAFWHDFHVMLSTMLSFFGTFAIVALLNLQLVNSVTNELAKVQSSIMDSNTTTELQNNPYCKKESDGQYSCRYLRSSFAIDSSIVTKGNKGKLIESKTLADNKNDDGSWKPQRYLMWHTAIYEIKKTPTDIPKQPVPVKTLPVSAIVKSPIPDTPVALPAIDDASA